MISTIFGVRPADCVVAVVPEPATDGLICAVRNAGGALEAVVAPYVTDPPLFGCAVSLNGRPLLVVTQRAGRAVYAMLLTGTPSLDQRVDIRFRCAFALQGDPNVVVADPGEHVWGPYATDPSDYVAIHRFSRDLAHGVLAGSAIYDASELANLTD